MKKIVAPLAPLVALLLVPACGAEREEVPGPNPPPSPTAAEVAPPPAPAETASAPAATTPEPAPKLPLLQLQKAAIQSLLAAFNAHDAKKLASLYAPDAQVGSPGPAGWMEERGPAAVEEGHTRLFAAFPDLKWASPRVYITGNVAVQEWVSTATHKGDLGSKKPTDKPVGINGASVYWFNEDGLITRDHTYYDSETMAAQIGDKKTKARPVPTLPTGETQFIVASGSQEDNKWVNAAKALYAAFGKDEKGFLSAFTSDIVHMAYSKPEDRRGEKAAREDYGTLLKAFPDVHVAPQNVWGFGDRVIAEVAMTGTHTGPLGTIKPTKKAVTTHSLDFLRFNAEGKVTEMVSYGSSSELLNQLGVGQPAASGKTETKGGEKTEPKPQPPHATKPQPKK